MPAPPIAVALLPGTMIANEYRMVRPLAEGGMGSVYLVEQLSTGRQRALKIMHADLLSEPAFAKRFVQEARVGAGLETDHIVEVVGAGIDETLGLPWLAMELLKGEDLGTALKRRGAFPRPEIAVIFEHLSHALSAAHAKGIVHRDLKPENIFLATARTTGQPFTVKILDFGIAKVVAEGHTHTTAALGSPLWMAPEQTEAGRPITPATDVWAVGLIAFRLLTGKCYWRGAAAESSSPVMLLREVVFEPLVPASERAKELGCEQSLPEGFDSWFARAVAREPAERFPNAKEMYRALAPLLGATRSQDFDPLGRTLPQSALPDFRVVLPSTPRAVVRPELEEDPTDVIEQPRPKAQSAGASQTTRLWYALVIGVLVVVGVVVGVRKVIRQAEDAAARIVASAEQVRQQEKEQLQTQELKKKVAEKRVEIDRLLGAMVALPAGTFDLGSDDGANNEAPVHKVNVSAFEIDSWEVTVAAWSLCVRDGKCATPPQNPHCNFGKPERLQHPVNCVDFKQAQAFCDWAGKRLPTEEEWEYAARGGVGMTYPWGKSEPPQPVCWKRPEDAGAAPGTCPIGEPGSDETPLHVKGLAANVREWTSSAFCPYSRKECPSTSRVLRGGAWRDTELAALRASTRIAKAPEYQSDEVGLRCARNPL